MVISLRSRENIQERVHKNAEHALSHFLSPAGAEAGHMDTSYTLALPALKLIHIPLSHHEKDSSFVYVLYCVRLLLRARGQSHPPLCRGRANQHPSTLRQNG